MKKLIFISALFAVLFLYFKSQAIGNEGIEGNIVRPIKATKTWRFKIQNSNPDSIGYDVYEDDEDVGVKGIAVKEPYIYLTDVFHNNIKRVDLKTGKIVSSQALCKKDEMVWLRQIVVFNDTLYVTADTKRIYVYSLDLKLIKELPEPDGQKHIASVAKDSLNIFLSEDEQQKDLSVPYNYLVIRKSGTSKVIKKVVPVQQLKEDDKVTSMNGKKFTTETINGKLCMKTEYGVFELKEPIKENKEYGAYNFDFTNNTLAYFYSTPKEFVLTINQY